MSMALAFFGSDAFAQVVLARVLASSRRGRVPPVHVVVPAARRSGRGRKQFTDVPLVGYAEAQGVEVRRWSPDMLAEGYSHAVAVSFGLLIPRAFLEGLEFPGLNVHPSLLPQYRGASPLQAALLNHDRSTGVSVQTLHPTKFDHGMVVAQSSEVAIHHNETYASLRDRLADIGGDLLVGVLERGVERGAESLQPVATARTASYAPKLTSNSARINWLGTAFSVVRQFNTLGRLWTEVDTANGRKRVLLDGIVEGPGAAASPGTFALEGTSLQVATADGSVLVSKLTFQQAQPELPARFCASAPKRAVQSGFV